VIRIRGSGSVPKCQNSFTKGNVLGIIFERDLWEFSWAGNREAWTMLGLCTVGHPFTTENIDIEEIQIRITPIADTVHCTVPVCMIIFSA
jgi:hypothetical protein